MKTSHCLLRRLIVTAALVLIAACGPVDDPTLYPVFDPATAAPPPDKPAVEHNPLRQLLWGDVHIHTSFSTDAYTLGVTATPDDAYYFARGGTIEHAAGYPIRIDRPLDFAAVTDHSEYMGAARVDERTLALEERGLRERLLNDGPLSLAYTLLDIVRNVKGLELYANSPEVRAIAMNAWQLMVATADAHYEPGVFTTLVGYEWSSMPEGQNLHRNVLYRDTNVPALPFSSLDSENPEDLWDALDQQRAQGKVVMAIPHNANVSNGLMYERTQADGSPMTAEYAQQRMRNEPLSEIMQIKGTSETHPLLSDEDQFADFEIMSAQLSATASYSDPRGSYARDALRAGIEFAHTEGFNPYRFGVIGSSDSHNASSSVQEDQHHGKLPLMDGTAGLRLAKSIFMPGSLHRTRDWGAAGLAGVWAQENTRESVFDALARKETFATSGPRIRLRFFGGFDYSADLLDQPDLLEQAYALGVPMGGVLTLAQREARVDAADAVPGFAVWVAKDPRGANLDRLQIIKGWVDAAGRSHEKVYDVAFSDGRTPDASGNVPEVGNTVDIANATYSNTIGAAQLSAFWQDPSFDPAQEAFYYARAIEIPTPRWSTYDAHRLGVEAPQPTSLQERAISSAIWYQAR
ncbi:MAG: DUF3604 domain-containing protein [Gammaproteobacteria bacterium]|nr:DUF3604 domain-containing protein [Gammaproteobacteria bacterium]